jgi:hypothetical protein
MASQSGILNGITLGLHGDEWSLEAGIVFDRKRVEVVFKF